MDKYKNLERVVCKELEKLDGMYEGKNEFSEADAKKFDMLAHAWKSLLTAMAMHEANEQSEFEARSYVPNNSYARGGRNSYMSREAWNNNSGHYPPPWYSGNYGGPW